MGIFGIFSRKSSQNPKNQKIKNRPIKSLDTIVLQVSGDFKPQKMILSQVIQILVIFHKSPLKFGLTMKIGYFHELQRAISQQQSELFKFRKKWQLPLMKPYHICRN